MCHHCFMQLGYISDQNRGKKTLCLHGASSLLGVIDSEHNKEVNGTGWLQV